MKDPQDLVDNSASHGARVCLVSMEVIDPIFSGNGVASRSFARGILSRDSFSLLVLCARPATSASIAPVGPAEVANDLVSKALYGERDAGDMTKSRVQGIAIAVSKWGVTDRGSAWEEFREGMACTLVRKAISEFKPTVFVCVDWTASKAVKRLRDEGMLGYLGSGKGVPEVFACFCAFHALYKTTADDRQFYCEAEEEAMAAASLSTALSDLDAQVLSALCPALPRPTVLLPPLRSDIAASTRLGSARDGWGGAGGVDRTRRYITCCIRVTEAKNVRAFCEAVGMLAPQLKEGGFTPLLCGAGLGPKGPGGEVSGYAKECKEVLLSRCPWAEVHEEFLSPAALLGKLALSVLNVHPAPYEAYGMTIVEAAAAGTPSIIHQDFTNIGAAQLLPPADSPDVDPRGAAILCADTTDAVALADCISSSLSSLSFLAHTAEIAQERALAWGEAPFGAALCSMVDSVTRP